MSSQSETDMIHFSHPHPLKLSHHQTSQQAQNLPLCSACKLNASGWIYSCTNCNYILHAECSQKPEKTSHPLHQDHILSLLPTPIYPQGIFYCNACGIQGNGFRYHCKACNFDLHIHCASMPLLVNHQSHHHMLNLTPSPPYQSKRFRCNICRDLGSDHWLYRCNFCDFDAHLKCATAKVSVVGSTNSDAKPPPPPPSLPKGTPNKGVKNVNPGVGAPIAPIFGAAVVGGFGTAAGQSLFHEFVGDPVFGNHVQAAAMGGGGGGGGGGDGDGGILYQGTVGGGDDSGGVVSGLLDNISQWF